MSAAREIELIWTAYVNGGNKERLAMVDAQSLVVLTPESISGRRNAYVAKAGTDPVERKSAERSAATVLRGSRALFSPDVVAMLKVSLPHDPFAGVKLKGPGPQRYQSAVNPEWLLLCAESELRQQHAQQYLALVLCLWGGLRRKEADTLAWAQIDFAAGQIHIRRTEYFEPKTEESQRVVDLAPAVLDILRDFNLRLDLPSKPDHSPGSFLPKLRTRTRRPCRASTVADYSLHSRTFLMQPSSNRTSVRGRHDSRDCAPCHSRESVTEA